MIRVFLTCSVRSRGSTRCLLLGKSSRTIDCSTERNRRRLIEDLSHALTTCHESDVAFIHRGGRALSNSGFEVGWLEAVLTRCPTDRLPASFQVVHNALRQHITTAVVAHVLRRLKAAQRPDEMLDAWRLFDSQNTPKTTSRILEEFLLNSLPLNLNPASLQAARSEARASLERGALDVLLAHVSAGGARREALAQALFVFDEEAALVRPASELAHCARWLSNDTVQVLQNLMADLLSFNSGVTSSRRMLGYVSVPGSGDEQMAIRLQILRRCDVFSQLSTGDIQSTSKFSFAKQSDKQNISEKIGSRFEPLHPSIEKELKANREILYQVAGAGRWEEALRSIARSDEGIVLASGTSSDAVVKLACFGIQLCRTASHSRRSRSGWIGALHVASTMSKLVDPQPDTADGMFPRAMAVVADCAAWTGALQVLKNLNDKCDCHTFSQVIHCLCKANRHSLVPSVWASWRAAVGDADCTRLHPVVVHALLWGVMHGRKDYSNFVGDVLIASLPLLLASNQSTMFARNKHLVVFLCSDRWSHSCELALQVALHARHGEAIEAILNTYGTTALARQVEQFYAVQNSELPDELRKILDKLR